MCSAPTYVRFTPNSDRKSGPPQKVMYALPLKADITNLFDHIVGTRQQRLRNGEAERLRGPLVDV